MRGFLRVFIRIFMRVMRVKVNVGILIRKPTQV